eukprot:gb/GEZN01040263.1/.p1 GENE.gb/GEZN01040263.1/~~gb/GEZN01040263.1/.p1  ORF type:complete len:105 (+),score=7.25 gb/GEZN01040263.1/:28-315(+)
MIRWLLVLLWLTGPTSQPTGVCGYFTRTNCSHCLMMSAEYNLGCFYVRNGNQDCRDSSTHWANAVQLAALGKICANESSSASPPVMCVAVSAKDC